MSGQLHAIVSLHRRLTELEEADAQLAGVPHWMTELHQEHQQRGQEIAAAEATHEEASQKRRTAEAQVADAQEKQKQYQDQIGRVSTQREYGALLKEIDTVKEQISTYEQEALEALELADSADQDAGRLKEEFKELDERYKTELAKWEAQKPEVEKRATELRAESEGLAKQIPPQILAHFRRLRERLGPRTLSLVQAITQRKKGSANIMWHCSVCSYRVRPQAVVEMRNQGSIVHCDSCKSILYLEEESAEE